VLGRTQPRLWTPPLRPLTPETSFGFEVIDFARDVVERPLDPWQEWTVIHGGELLPDGRPRFRQLLVIMARQNGKTELLVILALYWLWVERVPLVLGTSSKLEYAAESWKKACRLARRIPELRDEIPAKGGIRRANGEQELWRATAEEFELDEGSRYKIAAANEEGGRSLTVHRAILDELRQHHDYSSWDAVVPAMNAVPEAQIWAISNMGSDKSVVLNDLRESALTFINTGEGDPRLGLIEYSAPEGSSPLDIHALAQANPNLGRRVDADALLGDARTAVQKGGDKLTGFKTEIMCIHVKQMDPAIDADKWKSCRDVGDLSAVRDRVALVVDVSIDMLHATLTAAAVLQDGRVRVEPVAAWDGPDCTARLRAELPDRIAQIKPRAFGWFPNGPAAALAADLAQPKDDKGKPQRAVWLPRDTKVTEIKQETTAVCMGFAEQVQTLQVAHSDDPLLNSHVTGAEKLPQCDAWRFTRKGAGHCDAAYSTAGAVHLARTLPPPKRKPKVVSRHQP
jgi:hypothetical protein